MGEAMMYDDIPQGFKVGGQQQSYDDLPQGFQVGGHPSPKSPDTSFISNYGQSFLNAANEGRIGLEGLGQSVGKALYGANPQDASEQAGRQAELDKIRSETLQSGVQPSGVGGTIGSIAGGIAGNPTSWIPLGEINGIAGLAKAGAKVGALSGIIQPTDDNSLTNHLINAGVGAGEGALASAALGKGGQALAEIPGGVVNRVKGALADGADEIAEQSQKNWAAANKSFKDADATGATLTPEAGQNILAKVKSAIGNLNGRHADTQAELADFEKAVNSGSLTLSKLDEYRQNFGDVIKDNTKSKIDGGGLNSDGQKAFMAKKSIMDAFDDLGDHHFSSGNAEAAQTLKHGINQWAQASRYDRVANMLTDAGGDPNKILAGATKLLKNTNGMNADEIAALKDLATRGTGQSIERALGTFGFDLGKAKNIALPAIVGEAAKAGGASLVPGGIPLVAAGTALRQTGKWAARGKGQSLLDTIMERETAPAARPPAAPPVEVMPPAKPLALPAPQTTITVDSQGNAIPMTPASREILGQSPSTLAEQTPAANSAVNDTVSRAQSELLAKLGNKRMLDYDPSAGKAALVAPAALAGSALAAQQVLQNANVGVPALPMLPQPTSPAQPQASASPLIDRIAQAESGGNPNAKNPNSSASGPLQFTNQTWADMVARYGKQTGITLAMKNDPQAQAVMGQLLTQDNGKVLASKLGRPPTDGELYAAHVFGAGGVMKLINAVQSNPNRQAVTLYPRKIVDANKHIFWQGAKPRTVADVYSLLSSKVT